MRWCAAAQDEFVWAPFGPDHADPVLYHRPSGQTHFLNAAGALLLQHILREPKDVVAAARELRAAQASPIDEGELREHVAQLMLRFEELGLVSRCPPDA